MIIQVLPEFGRKCVVGGTKFVGHCHIGTIEQLEVRLSRHRLPRPTQTKECKTHITQTMVIIYLLSGNPAFRCSIVKEDPLFSGPPVYTG